VLNHQVAAFLSCAQETAGILGELHKAFSSVTWFSCTAADH